MDERVVALLMSQVEEAQVRHAGLELVTTASGEIIARGPLGFSIEHGGRIVEDEYSVELGFVNSYPDLPPRVFDADGKIDRSFAHFMKDDSFCLGAPVEVRLKFSKHRNLLRFLDEQVVPYLFSYSYKTETGALPFGERSHGDVGLLEFYMEYFEVPVGPTLKLLRCLADSKTPPAMRCPCDSGASLSACHGPRLAELKPHLSPRTFERELRSFVKLADSVGIAVPATALTRRMKKRRRRNGRQKKHRR